MGPCRGRAIVFVVFEWLHQTTKNITPLKVPKTILILPLHSHFVNATRTYFPFCLHAPLLDINFFFFSFSALIFLV